MIEEPSEDDKRRAAADYLHFEDDDPAKWDIYFDTFDEALEFVNDHGWSFLSEDWQPAGLFEFCIKCRDKHGVTVGQLVMLQIKLL